MFELDKLYKNSNLNSDNILCSGCTILDKNISCHSVMDYEELEESPVLFLSDSLKYRLGTTQAFSDPELRLIKEAYNEDFVTAASVKCSSIKEADMTTGNMNICRAHLDATINKVKPKLVFVCGNLAMKMLLKKSGITNKRGKCFEFTSQGGHTCKVVPIFHPYVCIKEPKNLPLFKKDIQNAYEKYILEKKVEGGLEYTVLMDIEQVKDLEELLEISTETIGVDIETTGLDFKKDRIQTIAISTLDHTWVIPVDHKDSPFNKDVDSDKHIQLLVSLAIILENPNNKKIFHNAKFDLKFLLQYGILVKNVWDTKIMHHLLDENMPKSLMDLVKLYFPNELEAL